MHTPMGTQPKREGAVMAIIYGTSGNDNLITNLDEDDTLRGYGGDDIYTYLLSGGNDTVEETVGGNDEIAFGSGIDHALMSFEKTGNDLILYTSEAGTITIRDQFATGNLNRVETLIFNDDREIDLTLANLLVYNGISATFLGTSGDDLMLHNAAGADFSNIDAGAGHDVIYAGGGDDSVYAGSGNDTVYLGNGDDGVSGGSGNDTIYGGSGNDYISGGDGDDTLYGESGNDRIIAGSGTDVIYGGDGNDYISTSGNTTLNTGNSLAYGGDGDDEIVSGGDNGTLYGGAGNDTIEDTNGSDTIYGGEGNDYIEDKFSGPVEGALSLVEYIDGGAGDDTMIITAFGAAELYGGSGNDTYTVANVIGGTSATIFDLSGDNDTLLTPITISSSNVLREGNDLTFDVVYTAYSFQMRIEDFFIPAHLIENLTIDGTTVSVIETLTPNDDSYTATAQTSPLGIDDNIIDALAGNDTIYAGAGGDIVYGREGDDTLDGGNGNDLLYGGSGADIFIINVEAGAQDTINDFEVTLSGEKIDLSAFDGTYASFADFATHFTQHGADAHIALPDDQVLILKNVLTGDLDIGNFIGTFTQDLPDMPVLTVTETVPSTPDITYDEFTVNQEVQYGQTYSEVLQLSDGRLLFCWESWDPDVDGSGDGIAARVGSLDENGSVIFADEVGVSGSTPGSQYWPQISELPDGRVVFAWTDQGPRSIGTRVASVNADGSMDFGSEFTVSTEDVFDNSMVNLAVLSGGKIVYTWDVNDPDLDDNSYGIAARIGTVQTNGNITFTNIEFTVNDTTLGTQYQPNVTELSDDRFLFTWTSTMINVGEYIYGRVGTLNADDSVTLGDEFFVNQQVSYPRNPEVALLPDGRVLFTWSGVVSGASQSTSDSEIVARVGTVNADGSVNLGSEFMVNQEITNSQRLPSVTVLSDGRVVFVWDTEDPDVDGNGLGIAARVAQVNADGSLTFLSGEFTVNEKSINDQYVPDVAALDDGRIVFTWYSEDLLVDGDGPGISARIAVVNADGSVDFAQSGTPLLPDATYDEFTVNQEVDSHQKFVEMLKLSDGRVLFTWQSKDPDIGPYNFGISARVGTYESDGGVSFGDEVAIYTYGTVPQAAEISDGRVVFSWEGGTDIGTLVATVNADGSMSLGSWQTVNTETDLAQKNVSMTVLSGNRVVYTWQSNDTDVDGNSFGIGARVGTVNADGSITFSGTEFTVNQSTSGDQHEPEILLLADGRLLFTWYSDMGGGDYDIRARIGTVNGDNSITFASEFTVNYEVENTQYKQDVALLPDGRVLFTWQSYDPDVDGSVSGISARVGTVNADGSMSFGDEFTVNQEYDATQRYPEVAVLSDGRVVFVWNSEDNSVDGDRAGIAARVAQVNADGSLTFLSDEFTVNQEIEGTQNRPEVTALDDGRIVFAWEGQDPAVDGSGWAISARIAVVNADGSVDFVQSGSDFAEGETIPLDITIDFGGDGVGETLSVEIGGLPSDASLSAGTKDAATGVWTVAEADLADLSMIPGTNFYGDISLTVTGISTNASGATSSASQNITYTIVSDGLNAVEGTVSGESLSGTSANDELYGFDGDDTLDGGIGKDVLYGGDGADIFAFDPVSAFENIDAIRDFDLTDGDAVDLSDLLTAYDPLQDSINDFVVLTESDGNTLVSVDQDGTGTAYSGRAVAEISNTTGLDLADMITNANLIVE